MKIKLWVSLVLAFLAFVFITQNTDTANVRFLAWSVEMSLVLLVFITLGSGVMIGWLLNSYMRYCMKKKQGGQADEQEFEDDGQAGKGVIVAPQDETNTVINEKKETDE